MCLLIISGVETKTEGFHFYTLSVLYRCCSMDLIKHYIDIRLELTDMQAEAVL